MLLQNVEECEGVSKADIFLYLLRFADKGRFDLFKAAIQKLQLNASKYPVSKSRGTDKKYTEL
jgi:hypothetical protein